MELWIDAIQFAWRGTFAQCQQNINAINYPNTISDIERVAAVTEWLIAESTCPTRCTYTMTLLVIYISDRQSYLAWVNNLSQMISYLCGKQTESICAIWCYPFRSFQTHERSSCTFGGWIIDEQRQEERKHFWKFCLKEKRWRFIMLLIISLILSTTRRVLSSSSTHICTSSVGEISWFPQHYWFCASHHMESKVGAL